MKDAPHMSSEPVAWDNQRVGEVGTPVPEEEKMHMNGLVKGNNPGEGLDGYFARVFDFVPIDVPKEETEDWKLSNYIADETTKKRDRPFFLSLWYLQATYALVCAERIF